MCCSRIYDPYSSAEEFGPLPLFRNSSLIVPCIFSLKTLALEALLSLEIYNDFPFFGVGNYVDMF